jgi:hypothetical protein
MHKFFRRIVPAVVIVAGLMGLQTTATAAGAQAQNSEKKEISDQADDGQVEQI